MIKIEQVQDDPIEVEAACDGLSLRQVELLADDATGHVNFITIEYGTLIQLALVIDRFLAIRKQEIISAANEEFRSTE